MNDPDSRSIIFRLPRALKFVFWGAVAVVIYGVTTWVAGVREGYSGSAPTVTPYGVPLPYLDPAATASMILALGTAALAYSALMQSRAASDLVAVTQVQAAATQRQAEVLEFQFQAERERAAGDRAKALREAAIRRSETFPRIRVVAATARIGPDAAWATVTPGNVYRQWGEPRLGVQNLGKGPAVDLRVSAAWKVFDFARARTASVEELAATPWEPVPQWVPPVDLLDPKDVSQVETLFWLSGFTVGSQRTKRIVALCVRASWTNPDGVREKSGGAGLVLIPGAFLRDDMGLETVDFLAIGPDDAPPGGLFSREAPLEPTGALPTPEQP